MYPLQASYLAEVSSTEKLMNVLSQPLTYFCFVSSFNCSASSGPASCAESGFDWSKGILFVLTGSALAFEAVALDSADPRWSTMGETAINVNVYYRDESVQSISEQYTIAPF